MGGFALFLAIYSGILYMSNELRKDDIEYILNIFIKRAGAK